ncbi:response regulator [Desulfovibrio ferrophilus]|uniref:Response regulator receiver n=1 Tax=Desulfovibrio ferrophilus TaxID=241368 RepID=A0A2Z6AY00_9BACT|nr:response regulator transcription factor [Desulfovibrio ferrophilus]BBD08134.1 response regulator receiver [Desulfovibrio ferrophilus]
MDKETISILIIDDHPMFREGLKAILKRDSRYEVVAEAGNGRDGLVAAKDFHPDMALVDISLPDLNGIRLTRDLKQLLPELRVIIVSMHSKIEHIAEAFKAGASGYLVKESASEGLLKGLNNVVRGEYFLDSSVSPTVVESLMNAPLQKGPSRDVDYGTLTPREQEVMRLLAEGLSSREIAEKLFISPKTAENHRANLMKKLNLHSNIELIRYAARLGLIDLDLWIDSGEPL